MDKKEATGKPAPKKKAAQDGPPPRLKELYRNEVVPKMMKEFSYSNPMQVPRVERVVLNVGMGEAIQNVKLLESAVAELALITGQKPVVTRAKKAIAGFKVREDMPIGTKVTLRGSRMYEFLDRLISIATPRVRDFRGLSPKAFDGRGNYSMGVTEQIIFPEIDYDKIDAIRGMDIAITTSARTDNEAKALLEAFSFPFKK